MANLGNITGLQQVLRNLDKANEKIGAAIARGLKKGGLLLQAESKERVPVQMGDLKASSFIRNVGGDGYNVDIIVGYTKDYAVFVHEDLVQQAPPARAAHGKFFNIKHAGEIAAAAGTSRGTAKGGMFPRGEKQQAKFLEQPMREKRSEILNIVAEEVKAVR